MICKRSELTLKWPLLQVRLAEQLSGSGLQPVDISALLSLRAQWEAPDSSNTRIDLISTNEVRQTRLVKTNGSWSVPGGRSSKNLKGEMQQPKTEPGAISKLNRF